MVDTYHAVQSAWIAYTEKYANDQKRTPQKAEQSPEQSAKSGTQSDRSRSARGRGREPSLGARPCRQGGSKA